DAPESGSARETGPVPRGPVSPDQRHTAAPAPAARAARGHSAPRAAFSREERAGAERRFQAPVGRNAEIPDGAAFSRQRAPAREPLSLAHGDGSSRDDRGEGPPVGAARGRARARASALGGRAGERGRFAPGARRNRDHGRAHAAVREDSHHKSAYPDSW